jgi:hypothetical protein
MRRAPDDDPIRLARGGDAGASDLLRGYARRTRPGERESVAAWYRLRPRLDGETADGGGAPARRWRWRWLGMRLLSGALTAALILLAAIGTRPAAGAPPRTVGPGGASGWGELGAGGAEGSSGGGRVVGESASNHAPTAPRAG